MKREKVKRRKKQKMSFSKQGERTSQELEKKEKGRERRSSDMSKSVNGSVIKRTSEIVA